MMTPMVYFKIHGMCYYNYNLILIINIYSKILTHCYILVIKTKIVSKSFTFIALVDLSQRSFTSSNHVLQEYTHYNVCLK